MKFKNKLKMRLGIAIVYVIIGVLLVVLTSIGIIKNEVMLAFGTAFGACGLVMIVKNIRIFKSTENFIEKEIAEKDERNIMIWTKARSLTFSVYAVIAGIAIIVLYAVNMEYAAQVIAYNLCGAMGLMQIMPETYEWLASKEGITDVSQEDLLNPEINIKYGQIQRNLV